MKIQIFFINTTLDLKFEEKKKKKKKGGPTRSGYPDRGTLTPHFGLPAPTNQHRIEIWKKKIWGADPIGVPPRGLPPLGGSGLGSRSHSGQPQKKKKKIQSQKFTSVYSHYFYTLCIL